MDFRLRQENVVECETECIVIGVFSDSEPEDSAALLNLASDNRLQDLVGSGDISTEAGKTTLLHGFRNVAAERVLAVGCGKKSEFTTVKFNNACMAAGKVLRAYPLKTALSCMHEIPVGQHYMLARGPLPEAGFVYIVIPQERLEEVERLEPLTQVVIIGRVRAARPRYLGNPIVALVDRAIR